MPAPRAEPVGELRAGVLPSRLATAAAGETSGRLVVEAEPGSFELFFVMGRLVGARDEGPGLEASVRGVDACRLTHSLCRARQSKRRLSVELAEAGLLDASGVRDAVEAHAASVVGRGLRAQRGRWRFEEGLHRIPADAEVHLEASPERVLLEAVRSIRDEDALGFHLGDLDRIVTLAPDALLGGLQAALSPVEGFLMSRVSGLPTLSEVLVQAGPGAEPRRALLGLLCAGIVRLADEPPRRRLTPEQEAVRRELLDLSTRLPTLTHFELLGVAPDASPDAVRAAWARRAVRYHPDRHGALGAADLAPRASAVFVRMSEAYRVLSDPKRREAYARALSPGLRGRGPDSADERLSPRREAPAAGPAARAPAEFAGEPKPVAPSADAAPAAPATIDEQLFEARRHFKERRYWEALQIAERLLPDARGPLLRERLHLLCARCRAENPRWRHDAEAGLRDALEELPRSADLHYELARLYRRVGLEQRARAELQAALDCDPGHAAARAELLGSRAAGARPGILRGLRARLSPARHPAAS